MLQKRACVFLSVFLVVGSSEWMRLQSKSSNFLSYLCHQRAVFVR
jgi:hypothetical protein